MANELPPIDSVPAPLRDTDPTAVQVMDAIRSGDQKALRLWLDEHPGLANVRIAGSDGHCGVGERSLLHVATDWPGHFPDVAATIAALVDAGANPNVRFFGGFHGETPLHWAASSDDVDALNALLDAGADIDAPGAVIGGGTPLADARAFKQWRAAQRLVERGAHVSLVDAATLGLMDRVRECMAENPKPEVVTYALWGACHGNRQNCAEYLLGQGADLNWVALWEPLTPLDAAIRSEAYELAEWLRSRGAHSAR